MKINKYVLLIYVLWKTIILDVKERPVQSRLMYKFLYKPFHVKFIYNLCSPIHSPNSNKLRIVLREL